MCLVINLLQHDTKQYKTHYLVLSSNSLNNKLTIVLQQYWLVFLNVCLYSTKITQAMYDIFCNCCLLNTSTEVNTDNCQINARDRIVLIEYFVKLKEVPATKSSFQFKVCPETSSHKRNMLFTNIERPLIKNFDRKILCSTKKKILRLFSLPFGRPKRKWQSNFSLMIKTNR